MPRSRHYTLSTKPDRWDHLLRRLLAARTALRHEHWRCPTRKGRALIRRRIGLLSRRFLKLCAVARRCRKVAELVASN